MAAGYLTAFEYQTLPVGDNGILNASKANLCTSPSNVFMFIILKS